MQETRSLLANARCSGAVYGSFQQFPVATTQRFLAVREENGPVRDTQRSHWLCGICTALQILFAISEAKIVWS